MARAFGWIGLILLLVTAWGLWTDHSREWKGYQKNFRAQVVEKTRQELVEARERLTGSEHKAAQEKIEKARSVRRENQADYNEAQQEFKQARHAFFKADRQRQFVKSRLDAALYESDHAVKTGHSADREREKVVVLKQELQERREYAEGLKRIRDQAAERVDQYDRPIEEAESRLEQIESDVRMLEKRIAKNRGGFPGTHLEIKQFNLTELGRVDRCTTCHLGVEKPGFEDAEQPFTTHPNREFLFAHHPVETFGCTVCHGGQGRATTQEKAHGYVEHWKEPLAEPQFIQTSCFKCHDQVTQLPGAPVVMKGRQLFEEYGCWGCHQVEGFEPLEDRLVGPRLVRVGSKTSPEWLKKWITDPHLVRSKTRMPTFHFEEGEVDAIAAYLATLKDKTVGETYARAETVFGHKAPYVEEGHALVADLNCVGCHTIGTEGDLFAPELTHIADKARPGWIYEWLKDPESMQPNTLMPDFRLTDREAYVITEYLGTLKSDGTRTRGEEPSAELAERGKEVIAVKGCLACHEVSGIEQNLIIPPLTGLADKSVHELEFGYTKEGEIPRTVASWVRTKIENPAAFDTDRIKSNMPKFNLEDSQVEALLTYLMTLTEQGPPESYHHALSGRDKTIELGRRIVREHNCTACHKIEGVGSDVAPDLTGEGRKVRQDWLFSFLKKPYTIRPWLNARMPDFGLEDEEAAELVAYFAALDEEPYSFESFETELPSPEVLAAGKQLFEMFKCLSCHTTGKIPEGMSTENLAPDLTQVKYRLKPRWVSAWLKDPQKIQPGTRMPTNWPFIQGKFFVPPPAKDILGGDAEKQIQAVRDYLLVYEGEEEQEAPPPVPVESAPVDIENP